MRVTVVTDPETGEATISHPQLLRSLGESGYPARPVRELEPVGVRFVWQLVRLTPEQVRASGLFGQYVTSVLALVSRNTVGVPMGTELGEDVISVLERLTGARRWDPSGR